LNEGNELSKNLPKENFLAVNYFDDNSSITDAQLYSFSRSINTASTKQPTPQNERIVTVS
jgi:hypothetical protein